MAPPPLPDGPPLPRVTEISERGMVLLVISLIFPVITTVCVVLRMVSRRMKGVQLAWNDYWIILATLFMYGNAISEIVSVSVAGRGHHAKELPPSQLIQVGQTLFTAALSWTLSTSATKISLLLLYMSVFPDRTFRLISYGALTMVATYCIGCLLFFCLNCRPIAANWDHSIPDAVCGNVHAGWLGTGIANIITDVIILSLPMPGVWNLQLPRRTKIALLCVFGLGFFVIVFSIVRLITLMYIDPEDFPFTSVPADIFSLLEPCIMIICACLPIMRPLVRRILPSAVSAKLSGSSRRAGYGGYGKSVGEEGLSQKKLHEKFGKKGFVKQDDEVMLTEMSYKTGEMENNTGERIIRDNDNEFVAVLETPEQSEKNPRPDWTRSSSRNRIEVTQEWTVKVERQ